MIATLAICLIPIHSPTISEQSIEKVHALSLMGKRAHSDVGIHGSPDHRARRPNGNGLMGTLMGTLWARAEGPSARLLNPFKEMARPEGFEPPTPRFVVWGRPLKSLSYVTERSSVVPVPPKFSGSRSFDCYRETTVCDPH